MQYPNPLISGSTIAVTAFSSGVDSPLHLRLDIVLEYLRHLGFNVIEGQCLRENVNHVSAPLKQRAIELMTFLMDDSIDAVMPPWGGEICMDLLPLLDFELLKTAKPKWLVGFSDVSTIAVALTAKLGWASVHSANLMQLHPDEVDPLTTALFTHLQSPKGHSFTQYASAQYQLTGRSFVDDPHSILTTTETTHWQVLGDSDFALFSGRLIGGCLDTLSHFVGSEYFDLTAFIQLYDEDGVIFYFENAEMLPTTLLRCLLGMKYKGLFSQLNGILIGRNAVLDNQDKCITGMDAFDQALGDLGIPIIFNVDIGHLPPNLTLINGALAQVSLSQGNINSPQQAKIIQILN